LFETRADILEETGGFRRRGKVGKNWSGPLVLLGEGVENAHQ
jgi:hypothetical protein